MFKTHESMCFDLMCVFSEGHHYWRMVERDAQSPWFHLTLRYWIEDQAMCRTVMPDDVTLLSQWLVLQDDLVQVMDVQAVTPAWLNHKGRWVMEPLAELELAKTAEDEIVHVYTTVDGSTYCDPPQDAQSFDELRHRRVIYSRPKGGAEPASQR